MKFWVSDLYSGKNGSCSEGREYKHLFILLSSHLFPHDLSPGVSKPRAAITIWNCVYNTAIEQ